MSLPIIKRVDMAKIIIIGAGLTGISTAYHLEKNGFHDYKLFEKESDIGGLCGSITHNGFTFDYTGHLLHINDPYCQELITTKIGLDYFNKIIRQSYVFSQNTYTRFPFQVNLFGLPTETIVHCIEGYLAREKSKKKIMNFHDWVLENFGAGFGKYFFFPYQKKIFAHDIKKITTSWTGRFVPSTSLTQIIEGAVTDNFDPTIGYNAHFLYPHEGGIVSWVKKFASHIKNPIHTGFCVERIDTKKRVVFFSNGHHESYSHLITTMPLKELIPRLQEKSGTTLNHAQEKLLCNSVVNFNMGIARPNLSDKHWIYFPEKKYPFYRIGFNHNFSKHMVPENCSSLYGEFSYLKKSSASIAHLTHSSLRETQKLFSIHPEEIVAEKIIHIPYAYVIYDFWRERNLKAILNRLQENSIYSIGRYGAWKYSSMQEAVLEGKEIADTIYSHDSLKILAQAPLVKQHTVSHA